MLPGMELMACQGMAVPAELMQHVVDVESSRNPYAIGVVGGRLARQPRSLGEALATVRMLEAAGRNFSVGLAQINRANLESQGLQPYERAFDPCANVVAGSRILADCHARAGGDWGKAFSCYYSGNFETGYRHGYVQKVFASMAVQVPADGGAMPAAIALVDAGAAPGAAGTSEASARAASARAARVAGAGIVERRSSGTSQPTRGHQQAVAANAAAPVSEPVPVSGPPSAADVAFVF